MVLGQNKESIFQFRTFVAQMPHYCGRREHNLGYHLKGPTLLARPGAHTNQTHVAIGTENVEGSDQVLLCLNTDVLSKNMEANPVVARVPLPKAVQGTHWLGDNTVLVCVGDKVGPSQMLLFNIDVNNASAEFELKGNPFQSEQTVREIAVNSIERNRIAFGGYDQSISLLDFAHGATPTSVFSAAGDVSSVRWEPYHNNRLVSCTTNEGQLRIFDVNGPSKSDPAWMYQTDIRTHLNLYSHCQISEYQILLGYEDNYMEAIDIRKNQSSLGNFMTGTTDPYCYMVGDLYYREASGFLLASGMADFSVYKHFRSGPDKNVCKLWCHSEGGKNRVANDSETVRHAVFLKDDWVVTTQEGTVGLYQLD